MENRSNFIKTIMIQDLKSGKHKTIITRFPPEPNGCLHIGHARGVVTNFELAKEFGGYTNLRFDDTNPVSEDSFYVDAIKKDIEWLGYKWKNLYIASDYFDEMHKRAILLIKKGLAYVDDLSAEEIKIYRGNVNKPGKNSPYRDRSIEENLELFEAMRQGKFKEGEKVLRAKIDMASENMNMRDPIIYRIIYATHHNTKDKWCIYPMYDFAHPLEDAIEGITHSLCSYEFEDHRPLYDWVVRECEMEHQPRQIEFGRFNLTNTVMSKRYLRQLVEKNYVNGWDDPRMPTLLGLKRRGYTPRSIREFIMDTGLSKASGVTEYSMLEQYLREDLQHKVPRVNAIINPLKVIITNYPDEKVEKLKAPLNQDNEEFGDYEITFSKVIYIDRDDFLEIKPNKKWKRLSKDIEVRLMHAYFIKCNEVVKDEKGNIIELHCTYDKNTKSGTGFKDRKPNGTINYVAKSNALDCEFRLYYDLLDDEEDKPFLERINPHSMEIKHGFVDAYLKDAKPGDKYQFIRNGFYNCDDDSTKEHLIFNRSVALKSSFKKKQ